MGAIQKKDAQVHPSVQVSDVEDVLGELATKGEVSTTTSTKKMFLCHHTWIFALNNLLTHI